jgi:hypothetical protein
VIARTRPSWLALGVAFLAGVLVAGMARRHRSATLTATVVQHHLQPDGLTVVTIAVRNGGRLPRWVAPAQITLIDDTGMPYVNDHYAGGLVGGGQRVHVPIHVRLAPGCSIRCRAGPQDGVPGHGMVVEQGFRVVRVAQIVHRWAFCSPSSVKSGRSLAQTFMPVRVLSP